MPSSKQAPRRIKLENHDIQNGDRFKLEARFPNITISDHGVIGMWLTRKETKQLLWDIEKSLYEDELNFPKQDMKKVLPDV